MFVVPPQAHPELQLSLIQSEIHPIDQSKIRLWVKNEWESCLIFSSSTYMLLLSFIAPYHSHLPGTRLAGLSTWLIKFQSVPHSVTKLKKWKYVVLASTFSYLLTFTYLLLNTLLTQIHHKTWAGIYCITTLSFLKEMQVLYIQYLPMYKAAQIGWGKGKTWYGLWLKFFWYCWFGIFLL